MVLGAGGYGPVWPYCHKDIQGVPFMVVHQKIWVMHQAPYQGVPFLDIYKIRINSMVYL